MALKPIDRYPRAAIDFLKTDFFPLWLEHHSFHLASEFHFNGHIFQRQQILDDFHRLIAATYGPPESVSGPPRLIVAA